MLTDNHYNLSDNNLTCMRPLHFTVVVVFGRVYTEVPFKGKALIHSQWLFIYKTKQTKTTKDSSFLF